MHAMTSSVFTTSPRLIPRYVNDGTGRLMQDRWNREEHQRLAERAIRNQAYYDGTQYDEENKLQLALLKAENPELKLDVLPEHERINAASGHIAECVDFLADQLTDGFTIECDAEGVQEIVDKTIDSSDLLKNGSDEEVAVDNLLVQAAVKGDVPFQVLWDPVEETTYLEFWEAQQVEFDVPTGRYVRGVIAEYERWVREPDGKGGFNDVKVKETQKYDLVPHVQPVFAPLQEVPAGIPNSPAPVAASTSEPIGFEIVAPLECRRRIFWDGDPEDEPHETHWLGVPFIPWEVLRVYQEGVYGFRGVPLVTEKAIQNARRFDANEQQAYLTTRFNAHASVYVTGDQALLSLERQPIIRKDLADVLRFPGGTAVGVLQLPTDIGMIDHTHDVSADAIYQAFGLTRVDTDTISGLGAPSGYALEILNRKSEGKLKRVRRTFKTDLVRMVDLCLDMTAYRKAAVIPDGPVKDMLEQDPEQDPDLFVEPVAWYEIDPETVYAERGVEIRMGSGYIVDDVSIRDDFTAGLISHEEALRQRGYSPDEIEDMLEEEFAGASSGMMMDESGALLGADGLPLTGQALVEAQKLQQDAATDHELKQEDKDANREERIKNGPAAARRAEKEKAKQGTTAGKATGSTKRKPPRTSSTRSRR